MSIIADALKKAQGTRRTINETEKPKPGTKKYLQLVVPGILFVFLGMLAFYFWPQPTPTPPEPKIAEVKKVIVPAPVAEQEEAEEIPLPFAEPIILTERKSTSDVNDALKLSGIMYTPEKPLAVINGGIWGEKETIGEFKILKIEQSLVRVTSDDEEYVLNLKR